MNKIKRQVAYYYISCSVCRSPAVSVSRGAEEKEEVRNARLTERSISMIRSTLIRKK